MKKTASILLMIFILLSVSSCSNMKKYSKTDITVFDTEATVTAYCESEDDFEKKADAVFSLLREYHQLYDIYNDYDGINNIKTVNDNAGRMPVAVDDRIIDLLEFGIGIYGVTGGKTNIAMGSVLKIWHSFREEGKEVPPEKMLTAAAEHTDIENIVIDRGAGTVYISDSDASIDVGAIAKGYATEKAAEMIEENGWTNMALEIGGSVRTVGTKPDGEKWVTGVENPLPEGEDYIKTLEISDSSVVTSGSYQRYYEVGGVRYHHIIDPDTLMPENNFLSVTVICPDTGMGDALSTALFNMSEDEGRALLDDIDGASAIWVYPDGSVK